MTNKLNTLWAIFRLNGFMLVNRFIYYFKRLPLIGDIMPDAAYSFGDIKTFVSILMTLFNGIYHFFTKLLYVFLIAFLPAAIVAEKLSQTEKEATFFTILAFLSLIIGSFIRNDFTKADMDKYLFIKLMKMPAKQYLLCQYWILRLGEVFFFLPAMITAAVLLGASALSAIQFTFLIMFCHSIGEAFLLFIMDKKKIRLAQKSAFVIPVTLLGLGGAYVPLILSDLDTNSLSFYLNIQTAVLSLPFSLIVLILFVLSCIYITKYNRYQMVVSETLQADSLLKGEEKSVRQSRFADVQLKESDLTKNKLLPDKLANKTGYDYLNAIFFIRHRRMLVKPILIRLGIIAVVFICALVSLLIKDDLREPVGNWIINKSLPIFVFGMYCISIGERVCRAMFNNCDISLLRYGYYREPSVLMKNFKIRLFTLIKLNFLQAAAVCISVAVLVGISGVSWHSIDMILYFLCILCLSVFFSVHYLFLYYVFQPYTTDLQMKNPFFNVINMVVYFVCYFCLQLNGTPKVFTVIALTVTVIYILVALWAVKKFAPKSFRVK